VTPFLLQQDERKDREPEKNCRSNCALVGKEPLTDDLKKKNAVLLKEVRGEQFLWY
jgi:hypothetical protein